MTKYYFFKTVRNGGRQKLRALPGQTTYVDLSHRAEPVNTEWDVQTERESRTIQCSYPDGTVFGVKITSDRERDTRLMIHSRDNVDFYRVEGLTYVVDTPISAMVEPAHKDEEVSNAYFQDYLPRMQGAATQGEAGSEAASEASTIFDNSGAQAPAAHLSESALVALGSLNEERVDRMSAYVGANPMQATLLKLSRLIDRMTVGVAKFVYKKSNGDIRTAYGTLCGEVLRGRSNENSSDRNRLNDGSYFNYYDLQKNDWRCFRVENFKNIDLSWAFDNTNVPAE